MNNFIYNVGVYRLLHDKAIEPPKAAGHVEIQKDQKKSKTLNAIETIQKAIDTNQLGFMLKYVRC